MSERPISAYEKLGGLYFFPRTLDKIRKHARGALHPDHHEFLGKGFDGRLCHFLGIRYEALRARVLEGGSDLEILAWAEADHLAGLPEQPVYDQRRYSASR